jgi:4a-hydroxytetrahydrobiopterin dehydratase
MRIEVNTPTTTPLTTTASVPDAAVLSYPMPPLTDAEIEQRLQSGGDWRRGEDHSIVRELTFADFAAAIAFVNRVAQLAEAANHHPDILVHGWNKVRLTLSTHSAGGLTDADFRMASQIDEIP